MSEVQFVFYIIRFHIRCPVRLLHYTVPCQKSSPSFTLYGSRFLSEVQFVFYIIRFYVISLVRLLHYTVTCQKSCSSFTLYVSCQKSSPSFKLYGSTSDHVRSVLCCICISILPTLNNNCFTLLYCIYYEVNLLDLVVTCARSVGFCWNVCSTPRRYQVRSHLIVL